MAEFETTAEGSDVSSEDERDRLPHRANAWLRAMARRLVLFVSFGPGVLGFLWLIGRILKR